MPGQCPDDWCRDLTGMRDEILLLLEAHRKATRNYASALDVTRWERIQEFLQNELAEVTAKRFIKHAKHNQEGRDVANERGAVPKGGSETGTPAAGRRRDRLLAG